MTTHLVTTSEEQSWPKNGKKILFLGEWCKKHYRKESWSNLNSITAKPYVSTDEDIRELNEYAYKMYDKLLPELVGELNSVHNVHYSERYWNIIIGRWLRQHIIIVINRYGVLESAIKNYNITETIFLDSSNNELSTATYSKFISCASSDDLWNHWLYSNILQNWPNLKINIIRKKAKTRLNHKIKKKQNLKQNIKDFLLMIYKKLVILRRTNDAVIIKSYLSKFQEIKLQLSLMQFPQIWSTPDINVNFRINPEIRNNFFQKNDQYKGIDLEIRRLVSILIPACYLEGYKSTVGQSEKLPWPETPKFIFTSNSFGSDEIFKFWTAKKTEFGTPYYVGQHGNNYGSLRGSQIWNEITSCDKFFSWGWDKVYHGLSSVPAFVFNVSDKKNIRINESGGLLIVGDTPGPNRQCYDYCDYHERYQDYISRFLNTIDISIQNNTTLRLHGGAIRYKSSDAYMLETNFPNLTLDFGLKKIQQIIKQNRLTIYAYDSSGILESLSLNIPTMAFWHEGLNHLLPDAIPYYKILIDAEILHLNPEDAAKHLTKHWCDIELWWQSNKVQHARKIFCEKYARSADNPVLRLRELLLQD